ncbi:ATP-binding cassette domain-containing protein [endosymbiont of unidentified scaly snail isolate Monju]|uniref:ATP-binding cassette domain-containing protein n=1 Tax=endosymbiont of unidentified scaly snail isolate Monju TaxID=1248727 RepID=UPI001494DE4B|nr:ATP-binding cassette domain-containing protein [endosymbiont of unidentified scaly snail isolate Monju]
MRLQEGGVNLSQGQRARVALARALLRRPCILLLDEADAHLDLVAVKAFNQVLADFPGTVIMATHRRDAVRQADIV